MKTNGTSIGDRIGSLNGQDPYYLAIIDDQGCMSFTNSHFYRNFQPSQGAETGNRFFDLVHMNDRQQLNETLTACSLTDHAISIDLRVKNGHFRWVKWEISRVKKPEIMSEKFLCLGYEVAPEQQQKKIMQTFEQEYQSRNALFTSFMDHTPYFTWIIDEDENLLFANKSLLEYFHLDTTAFGKKLNSILPAIIADTFHEKHKVVLKGNRQDHSIIKSLMADGKEHVYQVIVFPVHGAASGMMVGGEALDITESYNARQEEKKVSERLLHISKATSEAIWDWNMQTGQIYFNEALHGLVGTDPGQVFDLDWCYQCIHTDDRQKVEQIIRSVMEKKEQSWEVEYRFKFREGVFKMMLNRGFIIYEKGEAVRMIGSLQDISEIRSLETQLVKQKLKQQKGVAEAIIQAQEDERGRIGHELHDNVNQILSSGQLYLSLLNQGIENFQEIKGKTMEILKLGIEEIRMLSRAMVMPNLKEEGLVASIEELVADLRFVNLFYISFVCSKSCDIELISQSKKITLFRIVQEQTKNIVKYSKAKNVEISLHFCNDQVRLEISDDGLGFDPKTTRRGLGLSNIYERTRLYNGKVLLTTAPGKGCSIIVNIPLEVRETFLLNH